MSQPYQTPPGGEPPSDPYGWTVAGQPAPAPYPAGAYPQPYPYPYAYPPAQATNGMAIASMIVSITALVACAGLFGIVGAILGHVARRQIRERGGEGDGMALAGIIIGWIGFAIGLVVIGLYVFVIIAVVNSDPNPTSGNNYGDWLARVGA